LLLVPLQLSDSDQHIYPSLCPWFPLHCGWPLPLQSRAKPVAVLLLLLLLLL